MNELKEIRQQLGLSQEDFARKLRKSVSHIQKLEMEPSQDILVKARKLLEKE